MQIFLLFIARCLFMDTGKTLINKCSPPVPPYRGWCAAPCWQEQLQRFFLSYLAAATTAARAILTATAIVAYDIQVNHGSHLLSNRHLSMIFRKKNWSSARACSPILLVNHVQQLFRCGRFRCKLNHQLSAAHHNIFLVERIKRLLAFLTAVDQTCIA